jgi:transposase
MALNRGAECLKKQREIARLTEENHRLKPRLRYQARQAREGFFGASTPSAKRPVKANTAPAQAAKPRGGRPGHRGAGRQAFDADQANRVVDVKAAVGLRCPACDGLLEEKGTDRRLVLDRHPVKAERGLSRRPKPYCHRCRRTFRPHAPGVLPNSLYGNQLMATAATMHDLHGIPLGRVCEQTGIGPGSLVEMFHRLARLFARLPARLIAEYRQAPVKHADETSWRTNGPKG